MSENKEVIIYELVVKDIAKIDRTILLTAIDNEINQIDEDCDNEYQNTVNEKLNSLQETENKKWRLFQGEVTFADAEKICNDDHILKRLIDMRRRESKSPLLELKKKVENAVSLSMSEISSLKVNLEPKEEAKQPVKQEDVILLDAPNNESLKTSLVDRSISEVKQTETTDSEPVITVEDKNTSPEDVIDVNDDLGQKKVDEPNEGGKHLTEKSISENISAK